MIDLLKRTLDGFDHTVILGFGREGRSTYRLLRRHFPGLVLTIADANLTVAEDELLKGDPYVEFSTGKDYLNILTGKSVVFKSPGVLLPKKLLSHESVLTSQTDLFIQRFGKQMIGVSGTKGKSTTSSLIYHLLKSTGRKTVLLGNIGIPAFDKIDEIEPDTHIVFELSAHQLQHVHHSPHVAVLLNIFPEHLDYFSSFDEYRQAKLNLFRYQSADDLLIVSGDTLLNGEKGRSQLIPFFNHSVSGAACLLSDAEFLLHEIKYHFSEMQLVGLHNKANVLAALLALIPLGVSVEEMLQVLPQFKGLPHRLEYVGMVDGIRYYNDSISTIPASAMAAIEALNNVGSIILGGYDRGLDYSELVSYLEKSGLACCVFVGSAGKRMKELFSPNFAGQLIVADSFPHAVDEARSHTPKGKICLLSPAAASYDEFHNFEHRGDTFKKFVLA